jgi:hypothetical protein
MDYTVGEPGLRMSVCNLEAEKVEVRKHQGVRRDCVSPRRVCSREKAAMQPEARVSSSV